MHYWFKAKVTAIDPYGDSCWLVEFDVDKLGKRDGLFINKDIPYNIGEEGYVTTCGNTVEAFKKEI